MRGKFHNVPPFQNQIAGVPYQPTMLVAALRRIAQGVWGLGNPIFGLCGQNVGSARDKEGGPYHLFQAALFTPGTGNWAVDPTHETPVATDWGHAFLRRPNTIMSIGPAQVFANQMSQMFGVGGQIPGQMWTQPLSNTQESGSGFLGNY
ncbi:MAG TPA: hypothetical protein VIX37_14830 [Candidatus Sulfotelmatobacter sp.]